MSLQGLALAHTVCGVANPTQRIREAHYVLLMIMEDVMRNPDAHTFYILVASLLPTVISLPAVWSFTAAAYASGMVA
jgi:hypothetical protein